MRFLMLFSMIFMIMCKNATAVHAANEADLDAMIEAIEVSDNAGDKIQTPAAENAGDEKIPVAAADEAAAQAAETTQPEVVILKQEDDFEPENTNNQETDAAPEAEEELVLDVFSPDFMASLRICREDSESKDGRTFTIKGLRNDKCCLTYGNYILNVPTSLLSSIHGFDDLKAFLKNKDMTRYKYLPKYTYEGLVFALDACVHKEKFYGVEEEEKRVDATIVRGLSADYFDNHCEIYLQNELELENETLDYGVTCRLPQATIDELEPYFSDIIKKYDNVETMQMHQHKEIRDADIALMYYLQQNNYCSKNNELLK